MPKLLNKIISNQINKLIDQDEYGILIANLPSLDINELCEDLNLNKKKISFYIKTREKKSHFQKKNWRTG